MSQSSSSRHPLEAVELSLGRLRLLGAALVVGITVVDLIDRGARLSVGDVAGTIAAAAAVATLLLVAYRLSTRMLEAERPGRLVRAQLGLDIAATVLAVVAFEPNPGGVLWVVVGLPVLEGALRFRLIGALATWSAVAFALSASVIVRWQPGQGIEPFEEMASPLTLALALGLPAGYLAERLTAELLEASQARDDAHDRAWLLAVLTVAGNDLAAPTLDFEGFVDTLLDAAAEFGFDSVDCVVIDAAANWRVVDERRPDPGRSAGATTSPASGASPAPAEVDRPDVLGDIGEVVVGADRAVVLLARRDQEVLVLRAFSEMESERPERIAALRSLAGTAVTAHAAMTERRKLAIERARLSHEATHDALTGLWNRTGLLAELTVRADGSGRLLFADLDGFKAVNDTHGHAAGDRVLQAVAERLRVHVPPGSTVARIGGDEFVLLVPEAPGDELVERLERTVAEPIATEDAQVAVGVSIGEVALGGPPEEVLRRADHAMYRVKAARRSAAAEARAPSVEPRS